MVNFAKKKKKRKIKCAFQNTHKSKMCFEKKILNIYLYKNN